MLKRIVVLTLAVLLLANPILLNVLQGKEIAQQDNAVQDDVIILENEDGWRFYCYPLPDNYELDEPVTILLVANVVVGCVIGAVQYIILHPGDEFHWAGFALSVAIGGVTSYLFAAGHLAHLLHPVAPGIATWLTHTIEEAIFATILEELIYLLIDSAVALHEAIENANFWELFNPGYYQPYFEELSGDFGGAIDEAADEAGIGEIPDEEYDYEAPIYMLSSYASDAVEEDEFEFDVYREAFFPEDNLSLCIVFDVEETCETRLGVGVINREGYTELATGQEEFPENVRVYAYIPEIAAQTILDQVEQPPGGYKVGGTVTVEEEIFELIEFDSPSTGQLIIGDFIALDSPTLNPNPVFEAGQASFSITYRNDTGAPPSEDVFITIDDEQYEMTAHGEDWSEGVRYVYISDPNQFELGEHDYSFQTTFLQYELNSPEEGTLTFEVTDSPDQWVSITPLDYITDIRIPFELDIEIGPVEDLFALATDIVFDPAILQANRVTDTGLLSENGLVNHFFQATINNDEGRIILGTSRLENEIPGLTLDEPGIVAQIEFEAVAFGNSMVGFENLGLLQPDGETLIPAQPNPALVHVPQRTQPAQLAISPDEQLIQIRQQGSFDITVSDAENIFAFAGDLLYNPEILEIVDIEEGDVLSESGDVPTTMFYEVQEDQGRVVLGISRMNDALPGVTVDEAEALLTVHVRPLTFGTTTVFIDDAGLLAPDGETEYPVRTHSGTIQIPIPENETALTFDPAEVVTDQYHEFEMTVNIANVENVFAIAMDVVYDQSVLSVLSVEEGDFLNNGGQDPTGFIWDDDNQDDRLIVGMTRLNNNDPGMTTDDPAELFTIRFLANHEGNSQLSFQNVGILAPDGETEYDVGLGEGSISVNPVGFELTAPENGEYVPTLTPTLRWAPFESPFDEDILYTMYWAENNNFEEPDSVFDLSEAEYIFEDGLFEDNNEIWWKVKAVGQETEIDFWCQPEDGWHFTVSIPEPPLPFSLISPEDNALIESPSVLLEWEGTTDPDPENNPVQYEVWISPDPDIMQGEAVAQNLETTSFEFQEIEDGEIYYWSILATDENTNGTWADEPRSFEVSINQTLEIPIQDHYFELISTNIILPDLNSPEVFGQLESLVIVYQADGGIFVPPFINTIGNITLTNGYRVFCEEQELLQFEGEVMDPETEYTVTGGPWNWLGYPFSQPMNVTEALAEIQDQLVIVMTDDGGFWIPAIGLNTLGNMQAGEGYMVITEEDVTFSYPQNQVLLTEQNSDEGEKYTTEYSDLQATGLPYLVLISLAEEILAHDPAEIELLDGNLTVGKGIIGIGGEYQPVIAWGGNPDLNLVGYQKGNTIGVKLLDETGQKFPVLVSARTKYGDGPYAILSLEPRTIPDEFFVEKAYPNPFNSIVTVPFVMPDYGDVHFTVYNVLGQKVFAVSNPYDAGYHRFNFDSKDAVNELVSGIYLLQVQSENHLATQKVLLLR
ncbi:T9SS type A sorting domain-containing protein [bacterium]|nr:T9SS type A sorting domain-containing protein [bacterium]